ncbi:MAG: SIS domain-containing protein [Gammaproteobacteria bacterium]|nr:SIS domain-containing protein [Gammaproteobacteria bacterium]
MNNYFQDYFNAINDGVRSVDFEMLSLVSQKINEVNANNGKVIVVGNGGSASIASHASIDFTKAANIRSVTFNESSLLTCFSNDYGYEYWVEKALGFYADKQDMVILISSSGQSENIINGAMQAKKMGLSLVTLSGFSSDNMLRGMGDVNLWVNSSSYNIVEMVHQTWILSIIDYLIENKI